MANNSAKMSNSGRLNLVSNYNNTSENIKQSNSSSSSRESTVLLKSSMSNSSILDL